MESAKENTKNKQKQETTDVEEEDYIKRKGKRRKKRGRDLSGGRSAFQNNVDPETQVNLQQIPWIGFKILNLGGNWAH